MEESTAFVGLDQHADSVVAAVLLPDGSAPMVTTLTADYPTVERFVRRLKRPVRCCYEAGPCGFGLQRWLTSRGLPCEVIAPALIPRRAGDRVKTDRRDAQQLAVLYRAGALTPVAVPSEADEAVRDLLRCRETMVEEVLRARHQLKKLLLRHGRRYPKRAWTRLFWQWVRTQTWTQEAAALTCQQYVRRVEEAIARLRAVETDVLMMAATPAVQARVAPLRCYRGVDTISALTCVLELGDARRFRTARQVMAYTGLVPSEHSSGGSRRQGHVTKAGNAHLRRVLVEAAWHYRRPPLVSAALRQRQVGQPEAVIQHAWTAQHRLHRRYRRLVMRGKRPVVAATAVARELVAFVWATLTA